MISIVIDRATELSKLMLKLERTANIYLLKYILPRTNVFVCNECHLSMTVIDSNRYAIDKCIECDINIASVLSANDN